MELESHHGPILRPKKHIIMVFPRDKVNGSQGKAKPQTLNAFPPMSIHRLLDKKNTTLVHMLLEVKYSLGREG